MPWSKPSEILLANTLWFTIKKMDFFSMQERRGNRRSSRMGFFSKIIGTIDSVLDTKQMPFRILLHTPGAEVSWLVARAFTQGEIEEHWKWLEENLLPKLRGIDNANDIRDFVCAKVASLRASTDEQDSDGQPQYAAAAEAFYRVFAMPVAERLVNFYSCSYWNKKAGGVPRQGWMYISDNHVSFHAVIMGRETRLVLAWTDVTLLDSRTKMLLADGICIGARGDEHHFYLLARRNETLALMRQLATRAMRRLLDVQLANPTHRRGDEGSHAAEEIPESAFARLMKRQQDVPAHALRQYFHDEAESEMYQRLFQLSRTEELELQQPATVFDPSLKEHVNGRLYMSQNYMCFLANDADRCTVILPYRDVVKAEPMAQGEGGALKNAFTDMNGIYVTTNDHNSCIFGGIEEPHTLCGLIHTHRDAPGCINVAPLAATEATTGDGAGGWCPQYALSHAVCAPRCHAVCSCPVSMARLCVRLIPVGVACKDPHTVGPWHRRVHVYGRVCVPWGRACVHGACVCLGNSRVDRGNRSGCH
eukprot:m.1569281 g.1569281  ORF g.1569281 m.1569281 type:complete len:534 (+) comp25299_c0_seq8:204-1805(+)